MNLKKQQAMFDNVKWYDSILMGADRCGSYDFCAECNKEDEYPCARASIRYDRKQNGYVRIATLIRRA